MQPGGAAALLAQLASMQQLTALMLQDGVLRFTAPPTAAYFSALTASTAFQVLHLFSCRLPAGMCQHMFTTPRTALEQLALRPLELEGDDDNHNKVSSGDVAALVDCCPRLQYLDLPDLLDGAELRPLGRLTHLTSLRMRQLPDAAAVDVVASLSTLRHLYKRMCAIGAVWLRRISCLLPRCAR